MSERNLLYAILVRHKTLFHREVKVSLSPSATIEDYVLSHCRFTLSGGGSGERERERGGEREREVEREREKREGERERERKR